MKCAWNQLLNVVPPWLRGAVDKHSEDLQEIRLRLNRPIELVCAGGNRWVEQNVIQQDLNFVVNTASQYSPWAAQTMAKGYITATGGHRIGICGEMVMRDGCAYTVRRATSVNIRVARDLDGLGSDIPLDEPILILGPPGSGKTTLLRSLIRRIGEDKPVAVIDERAELFQEGLDTGLRVDVLSGCDKYSGIEMAIRTMNPQWIAVDEITSENDCKALIGALWCGVRLIATAHAENRGDLFRREVYKPIVDSGCFDRLIILRTDKSWYQERMRK